MFAYDNDMIKLNKYDDQRGDDMLSTKETLLNYLETHSKLTANQLSTPFTTKEIAEKLYIERSNVSRILNELHKEGLVTKESGKPVIYRLNHKNYLSVDQSFNSLIGYHQLLKTKISSLKAAVNYPPYPLPIFISGMEGTGKTLVAACIFSYTKEKKLFDDKSIIKTIKCEYLESSDQIETLFDNLPKGLVLFDNVNLLSNRCSTYLIHKVKQYYSEISNIKGMTHFVFTSKEGSAPLFQQNLGMSIHLPNINRYSLNERFQFAKKFLLIEAKNLQSNISIESSTLALFLLYTPQKNIAQLANDIRTSCANAFSDAENNLTTINSTHLPSEVLKGFFDYTKMKEHLDEVIRPKMLYTFNCDKQVMSILNDDSYQDLVTYAPDMGTSNLIKHTHTTNIQIIINQLFDSSSQLISKQQLKRKLGEKLYTMVLDFINTCQEHFQQLYTDKNLFALSVLLNQKIHQKESPSLFSDEQFNYVLSHFSDEFKMTAEFSRQLEKTFNLTFSLQEIALMCLTISSKNTFTNDKPHPALLIVMHGDSGAKSIANVVNQMLSVKIAHAYDMPLKMPISEAYKHISQLIQDIDQGLGVLILSDMGSLSFFGSILSKEFDIKTRTLEMVSTPIAIESAQRILQETDVDIIYNDLIHYNFKNSTFQTSLFKLNHPQKKNVIITLCLTGEGSAIKLKNMIEDSAAIDSTNIDVIPLSILNHKDALQQINKIAKKKEILAIVGTINPNIHNIPFISIDKMLMKNNFSELKNILENKLDSSFESETTSDEDILNNVKDYLSDEIQPYSYAKIHDKIIYFINAAQKQFNKNYSIDKQIGLIVHIASSIENIILNTHENSITNMSLYSKAYKKELFIIKNALYDIEKTLHITFPESEVIYLLILLLEIKEN